MSTASTPYHTPGKVNTRKKVDAFLSTQAGTPIFKLMYPDGTGGSMEMILHNWQVNEVKTNAGNYRTGEKTIGDVGKTVEVASRNVNDEILQASYNFAETALRGLPEHEYMDVASHRDVAGFYVNPGRFVRLKDRRFPALSSVKRSEE